MQFSTKAIFYLASLSGLTDAFTVPSTTTSFVSSKTSIAEVISSTALNLIPIRSAVHTAGCNVASCTCDCPSCTGTGFQSAVCDCPSCSNAVGFGCQANAPDCDCPSCRTSTALSMSTESEEPAEVAEVPAEVAAMDGVADSTEAHNAERPARPSGTAKHKDKGSKGTPISDLVIGSMVDGTVKTVTSYGAFIDIGASTDALLHVSRLSADFVSNVEDIVKAGQAVSVRIVSVDADKNQIALSMLSEEEEQAAGQRSGGGDGGKRKARPQRSQGDRRSQIATMNAVLEKGLDADKFIEGEVVSILDFGAFVRFDAGQLAEGVTGELDGLVHISALQAGRVEKVSSIVNVAQKVQIRVKGIDSDGGKVSLSMITDEQEQENRPQRGGGGGGRKRGMFGENDMGAKDWKESLDKFQDEMGTTFTNAPVIQQKRK